MGGGGLLVVLPAGDGNNLQAPLLGVHSSLNGGGIQPAVGKDDHDFPLLEVVALEEVGNIALLPLNPQQFTGAAGADDVVPHQTGIHDRMPAHYAAVAGEYILDREHAVSAAKQVDQLAGVDGGGAQVGRGLDVFGLLFVDFLNDLHDLGQIFELSHCVTPPLDG